MSDHFPPAPAPTREIPGQRAPLDHPMRPDLPVRAVDAEQELPAAAAETVDEDYARWSFRVAAVLIDTLLQVPFVVAQVVGYVVAFDGGGLERLPRPGLGVLNDSIHLSGAQMTASTWVGLAIANLAWLSLIVFTFWNTVVRQGRRGASLGKQSMHLMVVSETDGRPIGVLLTFLRSWLHLIDLLILGLGYLWPLWDRKRQTFTDMIMGTAVLHLPPLPLPPAPHLPSQGTYARGW